jgi:hypothetical protein
MFGRERRSTDSISPQGPASERIQREAASRSVEAAMTDELPFKVVRINSTYEVLARAANLMIARGAYREAARMYRDDKILLYGGARLIEKNK